MEWRSSAGDAPAVVSAVDGTLDRAVDRTIARTVIRATDKNCRARSMTMYLLPGALNAALHTITDSTEETPWTIPPTNGK